MNEVKERPIPMSAQEVRAILDKRKTQFRRVMKVQPPSDSYRLYSCHHSTVRSDVGKQHWSRPGIDNTQPYFDCPYGKPGDRLWVREAWRGGWHETEDEPAYFHLEYVADGSERFVVAPSTYMLPVAAVKPTNIMTPIHMPRWASRITLEITDVRVQRLQDISEEDAVSEGSQTPISELASSCRRAALTERQQFSRIWDSINGKKHPWSANEWVWALTFKRVTGGAA